MTGRKVSDLPAASTLTGAELFYADINGTDNKVTADGVVDFVRNEFRVEGPTVNTLNIETPNFTSDVGLEIHHNISGTYNSTQPYWNNTIVVHSDDADASNAGESGLYGLFLQYLISGPNMQGGRLGLVCNLGHTAPCNPASTFQSYAALAAYAASSTHDNGTGLGTTECRGDLFGANFAVRANPGATNWYGLTGLEIDAGIGVGASAAKKVGLCIASASYDKIEASLLDAGLRFCTQNNGIGFKNGIVFDNVDGVADPLQADGTVMKGVGSWTCDTVFDFASVTATNYFIKGPNSNFVVYNNGVPLICGDQAPPAGGAAAYGLNISSGVGGKDFGIYHGSGVPTLVAGKGSLYLRTDGSGPSDGPISIATRPRPGLPL